VVGKNERTKDCANKSLAYPRREMEKAIEKKYKPCSPTGSAENEKESEPATPWPENLAHQQRRQHK
jgi:hypothetical protein